jgi:hypothetical protein
MTPCLRQVFDKLNAVNNTNFKQLTEAFDNTDKINVSIYNYEDSTSTFLGQTLGVLGGNYFEIGINTFYSTGSSEEDIAGTFMHEMIHAYLKAFPVTWDTANAQHAFMIGNLVDKMAHDLKLMFPNLPLKDAYAIAFNGLAYDADPILRLAENRLIDIKLQSLNQTVFSNSPITRGAIDSLGISYQKGGNKGTKTGACN